MVSLLSLALVSILVRSAPLSPSRAGPDLERQQTYSTPDRNILAAYYPDWAAPSLSPEQIRFANYHWIDFAFAVPDSAFQLSWDDPVASPALLLRLVAAAHAAGTRVKLSIGGWGGSRSVHSPTTPPYLTQSQPLPQVLLPSCRNGPVQASLCPEHPGPLQPVWHRWHRHRLGVSRPTRPRWQPFLPRRYPQLPCLPHPPSCPPPVYCLHHRRSTDSALHRSRRQTDRRCLSIRCCPRLDPLHELRHMGLSVLSVPCSLSLSLTLTILLTLQYPAHPVRMPPFTIAVIIQPYQAPTP
jgi:hypothetical protein